MVFLLVKMCYLYKIITLQKQPIFKTCYALQSEKCHSFNFLFLCSTLTCLVMYVSNLTLTTRTNWFSFLNFLCVVENKVLDFCCVVLLVLWCYWMLMFTPRTNASFLLLLNFPVLYSYFLHFLISSKIRHWLY